MNTQDMRTMALLGMAEGPGAAIKHLEDMSNRAHGTGQPEANGLAEYALPPLFDEDRDGPIFAALGFSWPSEEKRLFHRVTGPAGWSIVPTDHYLYKSFQDPEGRTRATLMIHHQDNDSWISLERRMHPTAHTELGDTLVYPVIKDSNDRILWRGLPANDADGGAGAGAGAGADAAWDVLAKHYPDYGNPAAYWDVEIVLPPSEVPEPVLEAYQVQTSYYHSLQHRRERSVADSGTEIMRAPDDATALARFDAMCGRNFSGYVVYRRLLKGGTELKSHEHVPVSQRNRRTGPRPLGTPLWIYREYSEY